MLALGYCVGLEGSSSSLKLKLRCTYILKSVVQIVLQMNANPLADTGDVDFNDLMQSLFR